MQLRAFWVAALILTTVPVSVPAEPIAPDPAEVIAQKFSEASDPQPEPSAPGLDYEMDMLRRARAEEPERRSMDGGEPIQIAAPAPAVSPGPAGNERTEPSVNEPRATVLLVLDRRSHTAGAAKPDPIICFDQTCWISNGIEAPAHPMARSQALALKSTDTAASDSCSGKSGCVFRDVAFGPDARIEVVEVGEGPGAANGPFTVHADVTCRNEDGDLVCDNALVTQGFRVWVVLEATAQAIGPAGLEEAVADGLPDDEDGTQAEDGK